VVEAVLKSLREKIMKSSRMPAVVVLCLTVAFAGVVRADVREDQRTKFQLAGVLGKMVNMFGGKGAREGVESTVAVKGERKFTSSGTTGQLIDLAEEKVYDIDLKKKTYTVVTFTELRRQMEEARKKAEEDARKAAAERKDSPAPAPEKADPAKPEKEVEVDFDVKNTGQTKTLNGFDTHQSIVTITVREKGKTLEQSGGLVMTSDMWLAPRNAAMNEVAQFDLKYAQKLYGAMMTGASPQEMASAMAMYPQMKPALERMRAEGGKLEGTPILTTMTMDAVRSAEEMASESSKPASSASAGSPGEEVLKMFGRFGRKSPKKDEAPAAATVSSPSHTTFMTTSVEVLKLTTTVSVEEVSIPAGFSQAR
jgi:hypothetical protein